ncbi:protein UBASH3A homolog isoform X2 [Ischnura elegans]|uniref:protein UBASH3A homolog isoform X2 n=1 Tax=Ischnura elegans TaxID=197161 RepID=UPI001ED8BF3E|nr:protein UBASH3A homolog isoform X2 [Ischnura elegans]
MATLPPRKNPTPTKILKQYLSPLQILLQMGFPKHRSEKALAATGHRGVQLASDWLLAHVNDPTIDVITPREYIVYACPTGPFLRQLQSFWRKSSDQCQWNGAHNYMPHITLVSFFMAPDDLTENLVTLLEKVYDDFRPEWSEDNPVKLESYASPNFMGFFMDDEHANILKNIAAKYTSGITSIGCLKGPQEANVKSMHLTLTYQFPPEEYDTLRALVAEIEPPLPSNWELRLYSRDSRIGKNQVHKVLYSHVPRESDELELRIGDYIYVSGDALENSPDGWVEGISWLTGCSGYLPSNYIERTAESDAWTLHKVLQLGKSDETDETEESDISSMAKSVSMPESLSASNDPLPSIDEKLYDDSLKARGDVIEEKNEDAGKIEVDTKDEPQDEKPLVDQQKGSARKMYVVRHGERVDFTFGQWIPFCFDSAGDYLRKDLNMPKVMPARKSGPSGFQRDCPLTNVGELQALLTGEAMREHGVKIQHVLCSPSLRCVQTCTGILKGLGMLHLPIAIEPGLFEWLGWYVEELPNWMDAEDLINAGFNVMTNREPYVSVETLANQRKETVENFYERCHFVIRKALEDTARDGGSGNLLVVAHAANLDTCTRQLVGLAPRPTHDMRRLCQKVPYCSVAMVQEVPDVDMNIEMRDHELEGKVWRLCEPPFPPVTHSSNIRFDWKIILGDNLLLKLNEKI